MPYKNKEQQLEYQRKWMAKRRSDYFSGKVCVKCGANEDLKLDHIDPALKVDHRIWSWSESRRNEELAKCQILCHPCHVQKTYIDCGYEVPDHGDNRYKGFGCRCEICREAHRLARI